MAGVQNETEILYNPSSLLGVFANTLNNETTRRPFKIKGIYVPGNGVTYQGFYYDTLKDEATQTTLTLVVPGLIRSKLTANKVIECNAYLIKRLQANGGRIDLHVNVTEVIAQNQSSISDDQIKSFEILQRKAELGHKDVDSFIKSKIINGEPITINVLIGKGGIIDDDIKHQLQEALGFYKLFFTRINLSSEKEIVENLNYYQKKCDILDISRGGGDNLEIFNTLQIAETSLTLAVPFITAIGHQQDVTLLQKVADKAFITPTAFGQYLRDIYNNTVEQLEHSKAKLVDDVKRQLQANYEQQLTNVNERLKNLDELKERELGLLNQQLKNEQEQKVSLGERVKELQSQKQIIHVPGYVYLLIVLALIIGWVVAKLM